MGGTTRSRGRDLRGRGLAAGRDMAWRLLGAPPEARDSQALGVAQSGVDSSAAPNRQRAGRSAEQPPASHVTRWRELRQAGLRVENGLRLFTRDRVRIQFEPPVQLNNTALYLYRNLRIGRYSYLRGGTVRHVESIGRYTSIGPGVLLGEAEHPVDWLTTSPAAFFAERYEFYPPEADAADRIIRRTDENTDPATRQLVTIGNDVWIGANVMVRRGVRIGDGAIVGSGAFVNRDVPPYSIVGGLPAKQIGMRFDEDTVQRLMALRWWEFDISDLAGIDFAAVPEAIEKIQSQEASGAIARIPVRYSSVVLTRKGYTSLSVNRKDKERAEARLARQAASPPGR